MMAYGEFYVERQGWARWPKTLIMCRKRGREIIERRRYVPKRTCECDGTISWEWTGPTTYYEHELSCGHVITSVDNEPPKFCPECGARVLRNTPKYSETDAKAVGE